MKKRKKIRSRLVIFVSIFVILTFIGVNKMSLSNIEVVEAEKVSGQTMENKKDTIIDLREEYSLTGTSYVGDEQIEIITNVNDIVVMVNKDRSLPSDYIPSDLVVPNVKFSFLQELPKKNMKKEGAIALEKLFEDAEKEGIELYAVSGYRAYERQNILFNYYVSKFGEEEASEFSARPGQSEHQTGLAMDISAKSVEYKLTDKFEETEEGKWVKENSYKYGFIIRYPKDKTDITGYSYEPWHIRYVGNDVAEYIYNNKITLEEFFKEK